MPENNKNKAHEASMESDELTIKPQGESGSEKEEKTETKETPKSSESSTSQNKEPSASPEPARKAPQKGQKVTKKEPVGTFDLKLKELNKKNAQKKIRDNIEKKEKVIKEETKAVRKIEKEPKSLGLQIIKVLFLIIVGFGFFALTIYLQNFVKAEQQVFFDDRYLLEIPSNETILIELNNQKFKIKGEYEIKGNELINTQSVTGVTLNIPLKGILRLDKNTILSIEEFNIIENRYELTLNQGQVWGNLLYNFFDLKINSGQISTIPSHSLFNIEYDGERSNIYSAKHDVAIEILANGNVISKLWIAEGNKAQFLNTKIEQEADKIEQLLYSKLIKEFNYGRASVQEATQNNWISENIQKDNNFKKSINEEFIKQIRDRGLKNLSTDSLRFKTKQIIKELREALTFTDKKKATSLINDIFENINDSAFLYLQGNETDARIRLSLFEDDINDQILLQNEFASELLYEYLLEYLEDYLYLTPDNQLYPIKALLFKEIFESNVRKNLPVKEQYDLLTLKLNDVYDAVESDLKDSYILLQDYFELYESLTANYQDNLSEIKNQIIKQNILVDNLLYFDSKFYKIDIFESKKKIEQDYLATIKGTRNKQEQRQTFINEKITLLNRIQHFLFDEELDPADARKIVFRLLADMEELKEDTLDVAAINQLFERRLADFGVFWEYLKSDEYSSSPLHGDTHLERFEEFKEIQEKNLTFEDIRREIFETAAEAELTPEDIIQRVENDLNKQGVNNIKFGSYNDTGRTKVPILNAEVNGIEFRATYDWDRQIMSNIIIDDQIITREGVKLSKVEKFIVEYMDAQTGTVVEEPVEREPLSTENEIAKTAKVFVVGKFKEIGLDLTEEDVEIVNFNKGIYRIIDVFFTENPGANFSFDYYSEDDKVANVIVHTSDGDKQINGTFDIIFLDEIVFRVYKEQAEK